METEYRLPSGEASYGIALLLQGPVIPALDGGEAEAGVLIDYGMMPRALGENREAANCYRKMRDIMRQRPDDYEQSFETEFAELIDRLDPPTAT